MDLLTHRESRGSSGLREPWMLAGLSVSRPLAPSFACSSPISCDTFSHWYVCAMLFLSPTCSISIAFLLCVSFSFCSLHFLSSPLPLSLPIGSIFSHHTPAFPCNCRLLCITFFQFRNQRKKGCSAFQLQL